MGKFVISLLLLILTAGCHSLKVSMSKPEPLPWIEPPESPVKVAIVLGGGGTKGLAHLGVLYELEQVGIYPDLIIGCSSGGIIGALYADDPHVKRLHPLLVELKKSDFIDFSFFASKYGLVKGASLRKFLKKELSATTFKELKIPLVVVATDLKTGALVELGGGELIPALEATSAVPGYFRPVKYLGRYLVDGGVANPIPVEVAKKFHPQIIIAVDVGEDLSSEDPLHFFGIARRGVSISHRRLSEYVTRSADVVIRMRFHDLGMFSDAHNQEIYDHGRRKARELMPKIERIIDQRLSSPENEGFPSWMMIE
ncbi:MAG: putative NTE family protein [Chlamydiae bacterium]|nr:putative NTE family protein [Chlamydiota bacterium]